MTSIFEGQLPLQNKAEIPIKTGVISEVLGTWRIIPGRWIRG